MCSTDTHVMNTEIRVNEDTDLSTLDLVYCILASCYIRFTLNICSLFDCLQSTWRP
jgi:hypothetical protein